MKIVEITWIDSAGVIPIWEDREVDTLPPTNAVSVGYLWESNAKYVTICQSLTDGQVARRFSIPRGCIRHIRTVRR